MARSRCCQFNKTIKGPGTSFQSPALSQKYEKNILHTAHQYLTKFHYIAMPMMMSQIFNSMDLTGFQKNSKI